MSQFATTMFNAAYFAGLQIDASQAHSEYFDRYPRGPRGHDGLPGARPPLHQQHALRDHDLDVVHAEQPHHHALLHARTPRGEQTAISESRSGNCTVVTTTRTITYPDGSTKADKFRATYRPGEGQRC